MKQENQILRGQLYFADLDPVTGSEQGGIRPVLVLQNNVGNRYGPTVVVAPITSQVKKTDQPTHVEVPMCLGLPDRSMVMLEQLRTIDKGRLANYMGSLDRKTMEAVNDAVRVSLALNGQEPVSEPEQQEAGSSQPEEMTLCLCPVCASQFFNSPEHVIRRVDPLKKEKDTCAYCELREGYLYRVIHRKKRLGDDWY